jgi:hypothetical protein
LRYPSGLGPVIAAVGAGDAKLVQALIDTGQVGGATCTASRSVPARRNVPSRRAREACCGRPGRAARDRDRRSRAKAGHAVTRALHDPKQEAGPGTSDGARAPRAASTYPSFEDAIGREGRRPAPVTRSGAGVTRSLVRKWIPSARSLTARPATRRASARTVSPVGRSGGDRLLVHRLVERDQRRTY